MYGQVSAITLCALRKRESPFLGATGRSRPQNDQRNIRPPASTRRGFWPPFLVRELEESKYEVVAGAPRLRAAKLAELEKLPVRVVKLTDAKAIEAQCVENLQRENIHPLEEALGFKSLLELGEPAYSIAIIASRAGKSEAYVYGRIRLADLIPPVAEAIPERPDHHRPRFADRQAPGFRGLWTSEGNSQVLHSSAGVGLMRWHRIRPIMLSASLCRVRQRNRG